jgi:hypothetical protein
MNQYSMTHLTLPKSPRALLNDLEAIKHIMDEKHQAGLNAKAKEASAASAITKGSEQVLKKAKPVKFCQHCMNKGGPHLTQSTNECRRYDKDGNSIAAATLKPNDAKKPFKKGGDK